MKFNIPIIVVGIVLLGVLLGNVSATAQPTTLQLRVVDSEEHLVLPFVALVPNGELERAFLTDMDGIAHYMPRTTDSTLTLSLVGYRDTMVFVHRLRSTDTLYLAKSVEWLGEVVVVAGENPANEIVRRVVSRRPQHDPSYLNSYRCTIYNKVVIDLKADTAVVENTEATKRYQAIEELSHTQHLLLMESVTERKYLAKNQLEDKVVANKVSGWERTDLTLLATSIQPFSFYEPYLDLFDIRLLNPISPHSEAHFYFSLQDTLYMGGDTLFCIGFKPLRPSQPALRGVLYVHAASYALQNVIAEVALPNGRSLRIEQQYTQIPSSQGLYWFPQQLNFTLKNSFLEKGVFLVYTGKSQIGAVQINPNLTKADFGTDQVYVDARAETDESAPFWEPYRIAPLNSLEQRTYALMDSIGKKIHLDWVANAAGKLQQGLLPLHRYLDLDMSRLLRLDSIEKVYTGMGIQTTDKWIPRTTLGIFGGYGWKDKQFKYGAHMTVSLNKAKTWQLFARYHNDYTRPDRLYPILHPLNRFTALGILPYNDRLVARQLYEAGTSARLGRAVHVGIAALRSTDTPLFGNQQSWNTQEVNTHLRISPGEQTAHMFGQRVVVSNSHQTTLYLQHTLAQYKPTHTDTWHTYQLFRGTLVGTYPVGTKHLFKFQLDGGIQLDSVPAYKLFDPRSSRTSQNALLLTEFFFQTMYQGEFVTDRYANLFMRYQFGYLRPQKRQIRPALLHNMGIGTLHNNPQHTAHLPTYSKGYYESGIALDEVLKVHYLHTFYIGLGAAAYYRYGAYAHPSWKDNTVLKLTLRVSL
jgi:hypothetical protein